MPKRYTPVGHVRDDTQSCGTTPGQMVEDSEGKYVLAEDYELLTTKVGVLEEIRRTQALIIRQYHQNYDETDLNGLLRLGQLVNELERLEGK